MKMIDMNQRREEELFMNEAAMHFSKFPDHMTFTSGGIKPGCYMALRWGIGNDCVVVVKLDDDYEVSNYQNVVSVKGVEE